MIKKMALASVLLAICLFTLSASPQPKQTWEYKFAYQCDEGKANKLAAEGWELMSMGVTSFNGVGQAHCSFKRPKV
jgi:hypothetical protein